MLLADIEVEKKAAVAKATEIMALADRESRVMTDEERASVQEHLTKADELETRLKGAKQDTSLRARLEGYRVTAPPGSATAAAVAAGRTIAARTIGQLMMAGAIGDAIRAGAFRGRFNSATMEFSAETLTETVAPAGGAALVVPDYRPGVVPILTQTPTVRELLMAGTTDSGRIIYVVETVATNGAAGVEETGLKPESVLRFDDVEEHVKKVGTHLKVSSEMLSDYAATASTIDARLRRFVTDRVDDQLLNGDGLAGNLLGLRRRNGLTPLYTPTTESLLDAIHYQITEITVGSFVMPTGIVMHPRDWHRILTQKAVTAGLYFGSGAFGAPQARAIWGLPVTLTTRMTQGKALIGAFGSEAIVFSKDGLSTAMSNSNEDDFIHNRVTVIAEERLALAVYRPAAFGEVDLIEPVPDPGLRQASDPRADEAPRGRGKAAGA